jgi:peptidylprolyl isomerase
LSWLYRGQLENKLIKKWQAILLSVLLIGIIALNGCSGAQKVKDGDTVKVDYTLTLDDGTVYDTSEGKEPLEFTLGDNKVIKGFEKAVLGMKVGETKTMTIPPDEAYGQYHDELVYVLDKSNLPELPAGEEPQVGQKLQGTDSNGQTVIATIIKVDETTVTVDANHPLAGKNLTFEITLVEIVAKE